MNGPGGSRGLQRQMFTRRLMLLGGLQAGVGALLLGRMGWLALAENERYALAAEENRVDLRLIPPRRGWIVDAHGEPLAINRPAYAVELVPALAGDVPRALDQLATVLPLDAEECARLAAEAAKLPPSGVLQVASDIGWEAFAALNVQFADMPGLQPVRTFVRSYPDGEAFGHVLGYVGPPTREQFLETRDPLYMFPGFRIGKEGVERAVEDRLRGRPGAKRVEVNARGRIIRDLDTRPDRPGETVRLTLDRGLQRFAARRIGEESVSVVVIDCLTGDLKCMLSMPAFDPNVFSNRIPQALWSDLQAAETKPLLNKVTQGLYVPGSTFKMVVALAALAQGIEPGETVGCGGRYTVGGNTWHCHSRRGHGAVNLKRGITQSCNVYFYAMARKAGPEAVGAMGHKLGLGERFDIPVPVQRRGVVPEPAWKMERFGKPWSVADTLNTAIGQGDVQVSPLQLAVMTARIATGKMVVPRLLADQPAEPFADLGIPAEKLEIVRQGMRDVVHGPGGTARRAILPIKGLEMAGKTGTAQVRRISAGFRGGANVPRRFRDHGLFVAFAPAEAPRYAVAVIFEHGMSGGRAAAPIARDVMTWIFDRERAETELGKVEAERERRQRAIEEAARRAAAAAAADATPPPGPPVTTT
jgi:penicillin-binding protein 2